MFEWYEKYANYPRETTLKAFDKPMLIFLGLTLQDFIAGVVSFIALIMSWDSIAAIPLAIGLGVFISWLSRLYREHFPNRFLVHYSWAKGLSTIKGVPTLFNLTTQIKTFRP